MNMLSTRFSASIAETPVVSTSSAMLVRIYPQAGIGEPIELDARSLLVGRENCSLILTDDSVSRRHASIDWENGHHIVADLGSTNGTFVNESRIARRVLEVGDRVRFGKQIFKYLTAQDIESQYHEVVYKIMTTDGLTQVYNKRYFIETLEREVDCSHRAGTPLAVMLMDLDKFKSVNDAFGHLAGDAVLAEFAKRAKAITRSGEVFARYGGEEFAMLCSRTTGKAAAETAERIRAVTAASPVIFESHAIPMTVSVGIAVTQPGNWMTAHELLADADQCLYVAKESGRNQVRTNA